VIVGGAGQGITFVEWGGCLEKKRKSVGVGNRLGELQLWCTDLGAAYTGRQKAIDKVLKSNMEKKSRIDGTHTSDCRFT